MKLEFDEVAHKYWLDGEPVPNVTSILYPISVYRKFSPEKMENSRQRGIAIHKMVELDCKGELESVPVWMDEAYEQWKKFVAMTQFEVIESELRVYNPTYKYAGTLDLYGSVVVRKGRTEARMQCYIDIKRSLLGGDTIGYQISAYAEAHRMMLTKIPVSPFKRFALVIREDQHFKMEEYTDPRDFQSFLTALNWQRLCEKHNIK